jgi:alkylhydroperoxidase family enzyme
VTEAQVAGLQDQGTAEFAPPERAALAFAEALTRDPREVPEAVFAELRRHWDERQVVELAATACLFNAFNRFNNALAMDLTIYPASLDSRPAGCD